MMPALFVIGAYLIGAIPFGLLIGLARGVDIRQLGSKNIGATNVGRVLGRRLGLTCLVLDLLKGLLPTLAAGYWLVDRPIEAGELLIWLCVAAAAVLGHVFPVYLRFRGGKGVATTIGVALGVFPYYTLPMAAAILLYAVVRFATGHVSLGSLTIALIFPIGVAAYFWLDAGLVIAEFWPMLVVAVALGSLIVVRHAGNIARLLRGEEVKLRDCEQEPAPPKATD